MKLFLALLRFDDVLIEINGLMRVLMALEGGGACNIQKGNLAKFMLTDLNS
jgi:hypothetical protein